MKKQLLLTTLALTLIAGPAFADRHHDGDKDGRKGHHGARMFDKHDTNGDGVISKAEFLEHAESKFAKMDQDSNGEISKAEAEAVHAAMKEKMKKFREMRKERMQQDEAPAE